MHAVFVYTKDGARLVIPVGRFVSDKTYELAKRMRDEIEGRVFGARVEW